ncbi:unnamed protein product [Gemmata massiliana]|uniref:Uncharacterized protein n=1 Tax=Gemmata massiliana TaxID=1210884 RepID=A0A6P2CU53_9BACT|nr:hypothetical protein [Gemmata massiliana]VTR92511.1 unnamed protein product [Gemmata massiliana]
MNSNGLSDAIERSAKEATELLRGVAAAAPECGVTDQIHSLLVMARVLAMLKSKKLKRRALLPATNSPRPARNKANG